MSKSLKILLVDDEEVIRGLLQKVLGSEGYAVTPAPTGRQAIQFLALEPFDVVISDIHMPGSHVSGIEVLQYARQHKPELPVILMTGFATMAETKTAFELGAKSFLAKPFKKEELLKAIRDACQLEEVRTPEVDEDLNYCKLSIEDFTSGKEILYNIFIRLSKSKYVKIAHKGEDISVERIRAFRDKGIRHLYLTSEDFNQYIRFNLGLNQVVQFSAKVNPQKKFNFLKHTAEVILEKLHAKEISESDFEDAEAVALSSIAHLADHEATFNLLASLNSHADFLYAHSLGVSIYACLIAKKIGWHSPATLYKLSVAGLLHDIGKKEISRSIIEKNRSERNVDEVKEVEKHSIKSMEVLSRIPNISNDVIQIALHHHERDHGLGYPRGLTKAKIHPLARLLAVADEFCNLAVESPGCPALSPTEAFRRLTLLYGSTLDPVMLKGLACVLRVTDQ